MKRLIFKFIVIFVLVGCNPQPSKKIVGDYYLTYFESKENVCVSYFPDKNDRSIYLDIVTEKVISIANNESFIFVKQKKDLKEINYYIIPIYTRSTFSPEIGLKGPLNKSEFLKEKKLLLNKQKPIIWKQTKF